MSTQNTSDPKKVKRITVYGGLHAVLRGSLPDRIFNYLLTFQMTGRPASREDYMEFFKGERRNSRVQAELRLKSDGKIEEHNGKLQVPLKFLQVEFGNPLVKLLVRQLNQGRPMSLKVTDEFSLLTSWSNRQEDCRKDIEIRLSYSTYLWAVKVGLFQSADQWNNGIPAMVPDAVVAMLLEKFDHKEITLRRIIVGFCIHLFCTERTADNPGAYITRMIRNLGDSSQVATLAKLDAIYDQACTWTKVCDHEKAPVEATVASTLDLTDMEDLLED